MLLRHSGRIGTLLVPVCISLAFFSSQAVHGQAKGSDSLKGTGDVRAFLDQFCVACHNADDKTANLAIDQLQLDDLRAQAKEWEKVVKKLLTRQMPPSGENRPSEASYDQAISFLSKQLDIDYAKSPVPGRTDTLRRLNRTEYQNAIRDLLALDIDATSLLPPDESSHGFDNVTVGDLSPTLLDRYITAAQKISRLAIGSSTRTPGGDTIRIKADLTQEEHIEGLPFGTRGGALIPYTFPQDGEYEIQLRLTRDRNEHVEGLKSPHDIEIVLDRARMASFALTPPRTEHDHEVADAHLKARISVKAGPHQLGVTFPKKPSSLLETKRQPYQAHYNMHRHPRISPALFQVTITGPFGAANTKPVTPSQSKIFGGYSLEPGQEVASARAILGRLVRLAYRRPVREADLVKPMELFAVGSEQGGFEAGIEAGLSAILVSPQFLFRIELDPADIGSKRAYKITDFELASRLSFFLWSSIPDEELLNLAESNELSRPEVLEQQTRRMLADRRSINLATNFAGQWLHLRNLESITPDLRLFPDFDDNLRQAFRHETELLFDEIRREDRPVTALLSSSHTYLNERLAKHYGIPHIHGSHFRRVNLGDLETPTLRGGLLRQGSVLTVTSYANRTSPVLRGKWILENLLGTPPPPPPANVPNLKDNTISSNLSVRERLSEHRSNPACVGCHKLIDPPGFALENFDALGRWRTTEEGKPLDASGGLSDGSVFQGVEGLEAALLKRPELFVSTLAEKLLTFAIGRGVEYYDAPAIREIVRNSQADQYRFSSLILGIVSSTPFQMRTSE